MKSATLTVIVMLMLMPASPWPDQTQDKPATAVQTYAEAPAAKPPTVTSCRSGTTIFRAAASL